MAEARRLDPSMDELFHKLGDAIDFEQALSRALSSADKMAIRGIFARTIACIHPRRDPAISPAGRESCANFLSLFLREKRGKRRGIIFTTNYDLMLYWILVEFKKRLRCWDGFDENMIWRPARGSAINVYYLHGAMHIYETGRARNKIRKLNIGPFSTSLVEAVRKSVSNGVLPPIVSEGTYLEKVERIRANAYMSNALDTFWKICTSQEDALFIFGHSLSPVDNHLITFIGQGRLPAVYISVFDDDGAERVGQLQEAWSAERAKLGRPPVIVRTFHSGEADVWKGNYA